MDQLLSRAPRAGSRVFR